MKEAWARLGQHRKETEHTPGSEREAARTTGTGQTLRRPENQPFMSLNPMIWLDWEHLHSPDIYESF